MSNSAQIDPRALRTRRLLAQALLELGDRRDFDAIDVGALAQTAGVSRSAFYGHYASKQDFLVRSFLAMIESMEGAASAADPNRPDLIPSRGVLTHVSEQRAFAQRFAQSQECPLMLQAAEQTLRDIAAANLKRRFPAWSGARCKETAIYVAGGFVGLVRWWMEGGLAHPPERVQEAFARLTENALRDSP